MLVQRGQHVGQQPGPRLRADRDQPPGVRRPGRHPDVVVGDQPAGHGLAGGRHPGAGQLVEGVLRRGLGRVQRLHLRHLAQVHQHARRPAARPARRGSGPACAASPRAGTARPTRSRSQRRSAGSCSGGGAGSCTLSRVKLARWAARAIRTSGSSANVPLPVRRARSSRRAPSPAAPSGPCRPGRRPSAGSPAPGGRPGPRAVAADSQSGFGGSRKTRNVADRPTAVPRSTPSRLTGCPLRRRPGRAAPAPPAGCPASTVRSPAAAPRAESRPARRRSGRPARRARPGPPRRTGTRCGRAAAPPRSATGTRPTAARRTPGGRRTGRSPA